MIVQLAVTTSLAASQPLETKTPPASPPAGQMNQTQPTQAAFDDDQPGQCVKFSRILRESHAWVRQKVSLFVLIGAKVICKRAGMGGAKSPIDGKSQRADMNRNRIMRAVLAAGLIFVAQARADTVVSLLAHAHGLQAVTPDTGSLTYGTYWHVNSGRYLVPLPGVQANSYLQIYSLGDGLSFLVDENTPPTNAVNYALLEADLNSVLWALAQAREAKMNSGLDTLLGLTTGMDSQDEGGTYGFDAPDFGTNLWLEIHGPPTNNLAPLTVHNTVADANYEIWAKTNLTDPYWTPSLIFTGDSIANDTDVLAPATNSSRLFYRAQQADPKISISSTPDATEPTPFTTLEDGFVRIVNEVHAQDVTVYYRISGTATNGVDYTSLSGVAFLPASSGIADVIVHPLWDTNFDFDETVTLTLIPTNTYLVQPGEDSATVTIRDYQFETVTNLTSPIGLDYDPFTNALIVSVNFDNHFGGTPFNFVRLFTNGVSTNIIVEPWSSVSGLNDEVKLAVVQQTAGNFTKGEMYFGTGTNGVIGKLNPDGTTASQSWATLTSNSNGTDTLIRGSLYVDQTGTFNHDLIAVTGNGPTEGGGVWQIHSPTVITQLVNIADTHLEGVVVLTNDAAKWGPWAGKIITGAEAVLPEPEIYGIDINGIVTTNHLGIAPEDFDIIPNNQDLYCVDFDDSAILKLRKDYFTNYVGSLLITQAGEYFGPPKLFVVQWNSATTNFVIHTITGPGQFEHVTFAPINLPVLPTP